jgi:hypothetical protein
VRGEPALLEDEQLLICATEHDPARRPVAAQVPSERGERQVDLAIARRRAQGLAAAGAQQLQLPLGQRRASRRTAIGRKSASAMRSAL